VNEREYIRFLEEAIRKFLEPVKDIPYALAIKILTGYEVLKFDLNDEKNKELLELLKKAADLSCKEMYKTGISTDRPNEAGNRVEPFVIKFLNEVGLTADKPKTKSGRKKAAGYPDIEIKDNYGRNNLS